MPQIDLSSIDPSRECLKFLEKRIMSVNYRGNQVSEHNRYNLDIVKTMLSELYELAGDSKMQIRDTDLSKRPYNIEGEELYAEYVKRIVNKVGRGTQDSVRKNLFVDFNRMGFINRFSKDGSLNQPYTRSSTKYVSISELGKRFIFSKNIFEQSMLYTRGIDTIMQGMIDDVLGVILELEKFNEDEYTFFISYINNELFGHYYGKEEIINLVREYRSMSRYSKEHVRERVSIYCDPKLFDGDKTQKRDFGNWKNETQQVFMLLNQTPLFEQREKTIYPKIGNGAVFENDTKLRRSLAEKNKYYEFHGVGKKDGFELHHVVPLCWATSRDEFNVLDNHKNLVYIDGYSHAKITQNKNKNVVIGFNNDDVTFTDFDDYSIYCENKTNIVYNPEKQSVMYEYNNNLIYGLTNNDADEVATADKNIVDCDATIKYEEYEKLFNDQQLNLEDKYNEIPDKIVEVVTVKTKEQEKSNSAITTTGVNKISGEASQGGLSPVIPDKTKSIKVEIPDITNGMTVVHAKFGEGTISLDKTKKYATVKFAQGEKKFIFPNCFKDGFLKLK